MHELSVAAHDLLEAAREELSPLMLWVLGMVLAGLGACVKVRSFFRSYR